MKYLMSLWLLFTGMLVQAQTATEVIAKADKVMRGSSSTSEITIQIIRPTWSREMSMKTWSKGDDHSAVLITAPAKDAGTVFLKRDKEVWNWVPAIERNIKMPPSMMSQSWMGTDFTNDDLVKEFSVVQDYTHKFVGEETIAGRICWIIEMTPRPDAAVVWGKVKVWVDQQDFLQLKVENYDEDGYLVNSMIASDIKTMGGRLIPTRMEMLPADEPGNKTVMIYKSIQFNVAIDDAVFSVEQMKRLK
jgi:outer membrane lipoprotein-sorting protein